MAATLKTQADKAQFLNDTFWCQSCLCVGSGCKKPKPPMMTNLRWYSAKLCCLRSQGDWHQPCAGELGLVSGISKTCCMINMYEFPPDPLMIAVCGKFLVGDPAGTASVKSAAQAEQVHWQKDAFWLFYCCCVGGGLVSCGNPVCESQRKCFCCMDKCETTDVCNDEGCCNSHSSCCCCASYQTMDFKMTPGIGACNVTCLKNIPDSAVMMRELEESFVPAQQIM